MSSIEKRPEKETQEGASLEGLEALDRDAGAHDLTVVARDLAAQRTVLETFPPEQRAEVVSEIRETTKDATDKLRKLKVAAALAMALASLGPAPTGAKEVEPITAESLVENPQRMEELLEGILLTIQREQAAAERPELAPLAYETNSVLRRMQDEHKHAGRYSSLAFKVGETSVRALASAAGLGLGVAGYDIVKEIAKAVRERRA